MVAIAQHFDIDKYRLDDQARAELRLARAIEQHMRKRRNSMRYYRMMRRRDPRFMCGRTYGYSW